MFHPLTPDLSSLSNDDLYKKYNELHGKFIMAHRVGSGSVINQMAMLLEGYREEMRIRHERTLAEASKKNPNFKGIIDIK